ncbi:MAG: phage major capsid protein [Muribaculaceae bacterium]|nr:phage major capsid protein [Muribaculaceae bacterium]
MKKFDVREMIDRYKVNCDRMNEIAEQCERENRVRNESEDNEFNALVRENQLLQMKMQSAAAEHLRANPNAAADALRLVRENASHGRKTEIVFCRDIMTVSDVRSGELVPLAVQEILKPLQEGFILDLVGLPFSTGLSGDFVWPMYEAVTATVQAEAAALSDTEISFSKLTASPERIGIAIPVSNQSLNQTDGVLETVVRDIMPDAIRRLLNRIVFGVKPVNGATNLIGPFAAIVANESAQTKDPKIARVVDLHTVPTFEELNAKMKAAVLEKGIDGDHMAWVMTKSMKAILEGTPINTSGIYQPMIVNDTLCGLPVYTTNEIRKTTTSGNTTTVTEYIGLGDWRYQPMGLFGTLRFIVDPYSKARNDAVDFVLNADYATKSIRPEAFILGEVGAAS